MKGHLWFRKNEDDEWQDMGEADANVTYTTRLIKFGELLIVCSSRVPPIDFTVNGVDFHLPMTDIWIPLWRQNG